MPDQLSFTPSEEKFLNEYFRKIESLFAALRTTGTLLSSSDYQLCMEWYKLDISLSCVLRGIRNAFLDFDDKDGKEIRSVSYCKWAVMDEWRQYKSIDVQSSDLTPEKDTSNTADNIEATLDSFRFDLGRAHQKTSSVNNFSFAIAIEEAMDNLALVWSDWLEKKCDLDTVENRLTEIDTAMMNSLCVEINDWDELKISKRIDDKLRPFINSMSSEQITKTRQKAFQSFIRSDLLLPRLSLYSLNT